MLEQENTSNIEIILLDEKIYKTKSYVRKAVNKYRNKKMQICPEFKEKVMESNRIYREKNKEKLNEKQRLYMQEYRRKKKNESNKLVKNEDTNADTIQNKDLIINSMSNLSVV
jgi:hypothetical protein